ncbi:tubulin-like doman-containing protein [Halopiger aswanensis]|uniref:Tubulin-like protein n=1 Tax=Halopiger aswanensis TaxID=148449 RepID=A0A419VVS2_9EURY|nr:tubulin-like doman-containing protein [Halopiger aswanensis]RKD86235.1 tubulin-like protein [Halopiger aswanensis]
MSERKNIVISLGTSGFRTATTIHRLVQEYGLADQFTFVSIETAALNDEEIPPSFETVELRRDDAAEQRFEQLKAEVPWLADRLELANQGATSTPPIGRFLLEYYHQQVYASVEQVLSEFVDAHETDELSTWLVGALSGGTAAGMLPLLSPMVRRIVESYADRHDIEAEIVAAGTVSKFEHRHQRTTLGPTPETYVNTNISLQQLTTLINVPDETAQRPDPYPIELPMDAAPSSNVLDDGFEIREPPLDAVVLLPVDEEEIEAAPRTSDDEFSNYREHVNWTIATAVLSITQATVKIENIFTRGFEDRLLTLAAASVRVPVEDVYDYFQSQQALTEIDGEIADLEAREADLEATIADLDDLIDEEADVTRIDVDSLNADALSGISRPVADELDRMRETVAGLDLTDTSADDLRTYAQQIAAQIDQGDDDFPHEAIAKLVFHRLVSDQLNDRLESHEFEATVEDYWAKHSDELSEHAPGLSEADPDEKYERGIETVLQKKRSRIKTELENTSAVRVGTRRELRKKLDRKKRLLAKFNHLYNEFTALQDLDDTLDEQLLPEVRVALCRQRDSLTSTLNNVQSDLEELREHRSNVASTVETAETRLTGDRSGPLQTLPLNTDSLESVSTRTFDEADHLQDLVDADVVDRDDLVEALQAAIEGHLDEPLEDYMHPSLDNVAQGTLSLLTHRGNQHVLSTTATTGQTPSSAMPAQNITDRLDVASVDAPFTVTLVALYEDVSLANTSELRRIHERWEEGTLNELFGRDVPFERNIAYPQLFVDGATGSPNPDQDAAPEAGGD